jgi:hypothetical protein
MSVLTAQPCKFAVGVKTAEQVWFASQPSPRPRPRGLKLQKLVQVKLPVACPLGPSDSTHKSPGAQLSGGGVPGQLQASPTSQFSVVVALQSVSRPSQVSARPGDTFPFVGAQSPAHSLYPSPSVSVSLQGEQVSSR